MRSLEKLLLTLNRVLAEAGEFVAMVESSGITPELATWKGTSHPKMLDAISSLLSIIEQSEKEVSDAASTFPSEIPTGPQAKNRMDGVVHRAVHSDSGQPELF